MPTLDILARLSLYLLADPNPVFGRLLEPLFTLKSIPDMMVVILLDWASPWSWLRQLRDWLLVLRQVTKAVDSDCKIAMDENMKTWRERKKEVPVENITVTNPDINITLPLGPGEWDEAFGIPLCVVCQYAEKTEILEKELGWKDEEFDVILQYLRTILLKHGASLIYTASSAPGSLQTLIRSTLNIHSLLQRNPLKHNLIDRDKILVPPNWDSWGKIRVLRERFDLEGTSYGWSIDIQGSSPAVKPSEGTTSADHNNNATNGTSRDQSSSAVSAYEGTIRDPRDHINSDIELDRQNANGIEVECEDLQDFLAKQMQVLAALKAEDELEKKAEESKKQAAGQTTPKWATQPLEGGGIDQYIGPVQFNMGGINVDAENVLRSLKDREAGRFPDDTSVPPDGTMETEKLTSFFVDLAKRGGRSATSSPK